MRFNGIVTLIGTIWLNETFKNQLSLAKDEEICDRNPKMDTNNERCLSENKIMKI